MTNPQITQLKSKVQIAQFFNIVIENSNVDL